MLGPAASSMASKSPGRSSTPTAASRWFSPVASKRRAAAVPRTTATGGEKIYARFDHDACGAASAELSRRRHRLVTGDRSDPNGAGLGRGITARWLTPRSRMTATVRAPPSTSGGGLIVTISADGAARSGTTPPGGRCRGHTACRIRVVGDRGLKADGRRVVTGQLGPEGAYWEAVSGCAMVGLDGRATSDEGW